MKRTILILTVLLLTFGPASAQDNSKVGSSGAQFLKIAVGSRYQALGEASVALANDVYAMYWNPAGLAEIENSQVSFTNVNYLLDINLNYIGYAKNIEDVGVFGAAVTILSMNDQEITTFEDQDGTGDSYDASSYAISLSYAKYLNTRFAFGASVKYIGEQIYNEKAQGFGFDFGTLLYTGFRSMRFGMSISNMGPEMEFSGSDLVVPYDDQNGDGSNSAVGAELTTTSYSIPMVFRLGIAYDFQLGSNSLMTLTTEYKDPNDYTPQGAFGTEFSYSQKFFLRGGYIFNHDEKAYTFGGGLTTNLGEDTKLIIDYAWQDFGRLQSTQRFSVGFNF